MNASLPAMTPRRYIVIVLVVVISLHYILSVALEDYGRLASLQNVVDQLHMKQNANANKTWSLVPPQASHGLSHEEAGSTSHRANATFVLLCRNSDINGVVSSIQSMEDRFNRNYHYPWVLLNDEPFTDEFKDRVSIITRSTVSFGLIPEEHWQQPDWIDEDKARESRQRMASQGIIYADSVPYRNMCRFNSGFFFHHELLQPYRYYWRVEPDVQFFCDVEYDPFVYMQEHDKVYSFTISLVEWRPTIPTLWDTVKEFMAENPHFVQQHNAMDFLSQDGGNSYNLCHFWSNFEIADMDFWRSEAYQAFFDHLEAKGGFYYERWGDAPVHSIAAALLARRDQIHFFRDIGYRHSPFQHCPTGEQWRQGRCSCNPTDSMAYHPNSCVKRFENLFS